MPAIRTDSTKAVSVIPTRTGTRPFTCRQVALDQLLAQPIAQARGLPGGAEDEQPVHAAAENVLDEPLQARRVQRVIAIQQGRDHGRDDAPQRPGQSGRIIIRPYRVVRSLMAARPSHRASIVGAAETGHLAAAHVNRPTSMPSSRIASVPKTGIRILVERAA